MLRNWMMIVAPALLAPAFLGAARAEDDWKPVTDKAEAARIRKVVEKALEANEFSFTDDDTKVRFGDRVGVRHHLNSCSLNVQSDGMKVETRPGPVFPEYRVVFKAVLTATYVRIDYGGAGGGKKEESSIRDEFEGRAIIAASKSEVKVVDRKGGRGKGDGRDRMMRKAPSHMTGWLVNAL